MKVFVIEHAQAHDHVSVISITRIPVCREVGALRDNLSPYMRIISTQVVVN
jgi:hypothetical protein